MKPIHWRRTALTTLSLATLLALSACDSGGPRTAESARVARAAVQASRAASAMAAAQRAASGPKSVIAEPPAPAEAVAATTPSAQSDDALITAKVTTGLAIDRTLRSIHFGVTTRAGAVTLKGAAPSPAAVARATEIARNVQGVTSVENLVSVQPG